MHTTKGKTIAQSLSERIDYGTNPEKTNNCELISSYACESRTADAEFLASKKRYEQIAGRYESTNVIAYQVRQSFKPGEVSPEEANQIGFDFAMRFLKGKHAFIVCTHTDKNTPTIIFIGTRPRSIAHGSFVTSDGQGKQSGH